MTKPGASPALLTPAAAGWRVMLPGLPPREVATIAEAAVLLPPGGRLQLALPCETVLFERLNFPATDRAELAGMLELQLEKTLPFPVEEVTRDFVIIDASETGSTLLSVAVPHTQVEALCQPLRDRSCLPEKIAPFVLSVAASCPAGETVLAVYRELGQLVLAVGEKGMLSWAQVIEVADAEALGSELPQLMLTAEMEGVPVNFSSIQLAENCAELAPPLRAFFGVPIATLPLEAPLPDSAMNLVPPSWQADVDRLRGAVRLKQRLITAGIVYLVAVAAALIYLAWLKRETRQIEARYAAARPLLEYVQARQARWNALAPALDPSRYLVEVLFQVSKNLPGEGVNITEFDHLLAQWKVVGEAPSANLAIDYVTRLKVEKELAAFQISSGPPVLLPNEHAQFSIFGKL